MNQTPATDSSSLTLTDLFAAIAAEGDPEACPRHQTPVVSVVWRRGLPRFVFSECGCVWVTEEKKLRTS